MQAPKAKQKSEDAMDSDADDEDDARADDADDDKDVADKGMLSPEDAAKQGELAEGVRKIKASLADFVKLSSTNTVSAETTAFRRTPSRPTRRRLISRVTCLRHARSRQCNRGSVFIRHSDRGHRKQHCLAVQEAPRLSPRLRRERAQEPGASAAGRAKRARQLRGHHPDNDDRVQDGGRRGVVTVGDAAAERFWMSLPRYE